MAIIRPSFVIEAIRGTADGVIFSDGLGGPYVKAPGGALPPPTARQQEVQSTMSAVSQAFSALTPEEVAAWEKFAKTHFYSNSLGELVRGNANACFTQININRFLLSGEATPTILTTPPANISVQPLTQVTEVVFEEGARECYVAVTPTQPNTGTNWYNLRISKALPGGASSLEQPLRMVLPVVHPDAPPSKDLTFTWGDTDFPASLHVGDRIVVGVQVLNYVNGQVSPLLRQFTTVQA